MRILHMCLASFYIDNYSYQENMLPKYHKKVGHDVAIIASLASFDKNGKPTLLKGESIYKNEYGIEATRLSYKDGSRLSRRLRYYDGTYAAIEKYAPDIIFLHGVQFMDIKQVVRYLKKHKNVKVFADNHADFLNSAKNWASKNILHGIFWKYCAKMIEPYVEKFFGVTPARVNFLTDVYGLPNDKVELLVMGADDERVAEAQNSVEIKKLRKQMNISDDDFLIVTGGKIDSNKPQVLLLMEAVNNIKDKHVKLVVFGSVVPELKAEMEKRCSEYVQYVGWIPSGESYKYFSASDLVVFPGKHSVFWEQVCGQKKPMVVRYMEGFTHIDLNGNCKFIREDSAKEIEHVIRDIVYDKEEYGKMCAAAESKEAEKFLYSVIAKRSIGEEA